MKVLEVKTVADPRWKTGPQMQQAVKMELANKLAWELVKQENLWSVNETPTGCIEYTLRLEIANL